LLLQIVHSQDIIHSLSNRSLNFIYDLLPNMKSILEGYCIKDIPEIDIDFVFDFKLKVNYFCFKNVNITVNKKNSFEAKSPTSFIFYSPDISFLAESEIIITKGPLPSLGKVIVSLDGISIDFFANLYKQGDNIKM